LTISNSPWFTKLLLAALVLPLAAWGQKCAPAPKGLSAWFTFDEPVFSKPGTRIPGKVGQAIHLDGHGQYYELPNSAPGPGFGSEDFSIELWFRTTETKRTRSIVDHRNKLPNGYLVYLREGSVGFQVANGEDRSDSVSKAALVADGRWHHILAVCRRLPSQPLAVYVDGKLASRTGRNVTLDTLNPQVPLWLGRHHGNNFVGSDDYFLAGDLDELTFYRRALEAPEALTLFRAGAAGKCRPSRAK
jgi:Concanavalin A-like lectin/glucanases superfamily